MQKAFVYPFETGGVERWSESDRCEDDVGSRGLGEATCMRNEQSVVPIGYIYQWIERTAHARKRCGHYEVWKGYVGQCAALIVSKLYRIALFHVPQWGELIALPHAPA